MQHGLTWPGPRKYEKLQETLIRGNRLWEGGVKLKRERKVGRKWVEPQSTENGNKEGGN